MADPYVPVIPGQPVTRSARTENGLRKSGQAYSREKLGQLRSGEGGAPITPACRVIVQNATAARLPAFSVIALGVPLVDPGEAQFDVQDRPAFAAGLVATIAKPFAITTEPIGVGDTGEAIVAGLAVVQVNVSDATHTRAIPSIGVSANLVSAANGGVPIVSKDDGTGLVWGTVMLGGLEAYGSISFQVVTAFDPTTCAATVSTITINGSNLSLVIS